MGSRPFNVKKRKEYNKDIQKFIDLENFEYSKSFISRNTNITRFFAYNYHSAILLGSVLGIGLYVMACSRKSGMRAFAKAYNSFLAGIPELVLLLIMFYVVFAKTGLPSDLVATITFALFFASGACDIYKTSLEAIPHGQTEAGLALGFTRSQTFFHIILPQAVRRGLPLYKGQCVSLLKGTSIVGYIAIQDLTRAGDIIRSRTFDAVIPLLVVTIIYFLLVWLIGWLLQFVSPKKKAL